MESTLILAFYRDGSGLASFNGSPTTLPDFRKGVYNTTIYIGSASGLPGAPTFTPMDLTDYDGLHVGIAKKSPAADNHSDDLAITDQLGWTYTTDDDGNPCFKGKFQTLTNEMSAWLGDSSQRKAWFAVNLVKGLELTPIYDWRNSNEAAAGNVNINNVTFGGVSFSIVMTQGAPRLPVGTQIDGANGESWGFVADPNNPGNLLITRVN